jgi:HNH endonuclease
MEPLMITDCIEWTGTRDRKGYGLDRITIAPGAHYTIRVHRIAYETAHGPIPAGMHVCHHCDNPPCINPDHLFVGTALDNVQDMDAKGRRRNPKSELTECKRGHPFTPENTAVRVWDNGTRIRRVCLTCDRERDMARYWASRRAARQERNLLDGGSE